MPFTSVPSAPRISLLQDGAGEGLVAWIRETAGLGPDTQLKILYSLAAVAVVWALRRVLVRYVVQRAEDPRTRYQWSKTSGYVAFVVGLAIIGQIWLEALQEVGTFLGLLSAGLAIALRDVVTNLAGWAFILWRRPFELGDRIEIGSWRGDVVDVRIFQFTLLEVGNWVAADQSTGRVLHVPNAKVFTESVANYTVEFPYVWSEVPVLLTFESDWRKAKRILTEVVERVAGETVDEAERAVARASRKYLIHYRHLTPIVYTSVDDSGVLLTLRYLCAVRRRRSTEERIWEAILDEFAGAADIDFAYPTRRTFYNPLEGKEEARAETPEWLRPRPGGSGSPTRGPDG